MDLYKIYFHNKIHDLTIFVSKWKGLEQQQNRRGQVTNIPVELSIVQCFESVISNGSAVNSAPTFGLAFIHTERIGVARDWRTVVLEGDFSGKRVATSEETAARLIESFLPLSSFFVAYNGDVWTYGRKGLDFSPARGQINSRLSHWTANKPGRPAAHFPLFFSLATACIPFADRCCLHS